MGKIVLHFIKCFLYPYSYSVWLSTIDRAIRSRRHVRFFHPLPRYNHKETPQSPYVIFHNVPHAALSHIRDAHTSLSHSAAVMQMKTRLATNQQPYIPRQLAHKRNTHTHSSTRKTKRVLFFLLFAVVSRGVDGINPWLGTVTSFSLNRNGEKWMAKSRSIHRVRFSMMSSERERERSSSRDGFLLHRCAGALFVLKGVVYRYMR